MIRIYDEEIYNMIVEHIDEEIEQNGETEEIEPPIGWVGEIVQYYDWETEWLYNYIDYHFSEIEKDLKKEEYLKFLNNNGSIHKNDMFFTYNGYIINIVWGR